MKSFEQLARAAYETWHATGTAQRPVPFERLPADVRQRWISVATKVAREVAPIL